MKRSVDMPCEQYIRRRLDGKATREGKCLTSKTTFKDDREFLAHLLSQEQASVPVSALGQEDKRE
ncbi:hypothetical protein ACFL2V_03650 [Pseudomonadota bacterium]